MKNLDKYVLFHGTSEPLENLTVGSPKNNSDYYFYGMFFSTSYSSASSHGKWIYTIDNEDGDIPNDDILAVENISYNDTAYELASSLLSDVLDNDELDEFIEYVSEAKDVFNDELDEELAEKFADALCTLVGKYSTDTAEMSWNFQSASCWFAHKLGYKAVAVSDEFGTSYIVVPGTKLKLVERGDE